MLSCCPSDNGTAEQPRSACQKSRQPGNLGTNAIVGGGIAAFIITKKKKN
jgi:hypothetical protein